MLGFLLENWLILAAAAAPLVIIGVTIRRAREVAPYLFDDTEPSSLAASPDGIVLTGMSGRSHSLAWEEITEVRIRTTDLGPLVEDVFWEFVSEGDDPALIVPGGAGGLDGFLSAVGDHLDGFDHEEVIQAMTSTDNRTFLLWKRT